MWALRSEKVRPIPVMKDLGESMHWKMHKKG
jgi:hypothetical protein